MSSKSKKSFTNLSALLATLSLMPTLHVRPNGREYRAPVDLVFGITSLPHLQKKIYRLIPKALYLVRRTWAQQAVVATTTITVAMDIGSK
jgi:hypothetical protein